MQTSQSREPGGPNWFCGAVALGVGVLATFACAHEDDAPAQGPRAQAATHGHQRHADPNTEPDFPPPAGLSDYNDEPLVPSAWHEVQHLEWLGKVVDGGEVLPNMFDDHVLGVQADDDGLLGATIGAGVATLGYRITTNFTAHPAQFWAGSIMYVDAWIDWNGSKTFGDGPPVEHLGTKVYVVPPAAMPDPRPFGIPGVDSIVDTLAGVAAGPPGPYSIRLRVDWHGGPLPAHVPAPGGNADGDLLGEGVSFGEVEDYETYMVVAAPAPPNDSYFCSMLSTVSFDVSAQLEPDTSVTLTAQSPVSMELGKNDLTAVVDLLSAAVYIHIGPDVDGVSDVTVTGGSGQFDAFVFGGEPLSTSAFTIQSGSGSIIWITDQIEIEELFVHVSSVRFSSITAVASGLGQIDVDNDTIQLDVATGCLEVSLIPTVTEWGLVVMTVLLLTAGTVVFGRRLGLVGRNARC